MLRLSNDVVVDTSLSMDMASGGLLALVESGLLAQSFANAAGSFLWIFLK